MVTVRVIIMKIVHQLDFPIQLMDSKDLILMDSKDLTVSVISQEILEMNNL